MTVHERHVKWGVSEDLTCNIVSLDWIWNCPSDNCKSGTTPQQQGKRRMPHLI